MDDNMNNEYTQAPSETYEAGEPSPEPGYAPYTPPSSPDLPTKKRSKKGMGAGSVVALALACSLVGGCMGVGGMMLLNRSSNQTPAQEAAQIPETKTVILQGERETQPQENTAVVTATVNTNKLLTASEVYEQNVSSTVGITVGITTNYWGYQTTSAASGSGFILTEDGYILTNYHVVDDATSITVTTYNNESYDAKLVGYDVNNDIAVLKVDAEGLDPVVLGSSDALKVGDGVVAIGNPLGELTFSLTHGVVSALSREITLSTGKSYTLIQTDTAINSGNSGGALFNMYGEVVGITNAKYSTSSLSSSTIDNISFAVPIDRVKDTVESIIEKGYFGKPYIGVSVATVSDDMQSFGIPQGAIVKAIVDGSPADVSELQVNDVITQVNGEDVTNKTELVNKVAASSIGSEMVLTVYRQGEEELLTITLTVGEQEQDALANDTDSSQQQQSQSNVYSYGYGYGFPFGGGWG